MTHLRKLLDLTLYSGLWIGLCAAAQVVYTRLLFGYPFEFDWYVIFILSSTIAMYSIHRVIGIQKVSRSSEIGRFQAVIDNRIFIVLTGFIAGVFSLTALINLKVNVVLLLAAPILISLAYTLPVFPAQKRLRDLAFIKVFLVAITWSALVAAIALIESGNNNVWEITSAFTERTLFIFAITLPFDIRDFHVDRKSGVRTIPHVLGTGRTRVLATALLALSALCNFVLIACGIYPTDLIIPYMIFLLVTMWFIMNSNPERSDYYFSGLLDGTMLLLPLLYLAFSII